MSDEIETANPLLAPLWRKWLALRVLALSGISVSLAFWFVDTLDTLKLDLPRWLETLLILPTVAAFFALLANLAKGITDLVVHFLPHGRVRKTLLSGDRNPAECAREFEEIGYLYALSPFFIVIGLFVLAVLCVLLLGGVSAIGGMLSVVAGWPSWAIVIAILLVLLLFKK